MFTVSETVPGLSETLRTEVELMLTTTPELVTGANPVAETVTS